MKELIPKNDLGIFADGHNTARVDSLFVAEAFDKQHKDVLRDIRKLLDPASGLSEDFGRRNFAQSSYKNSQNKKQPCFAMTRDGFTLLVMGYSGKNALKFKELYIKQFNEMESFIKDLMAARNQFPALTENIKLLHDNPKPYHFSNECNMLNRLVLGMSAKEYRLANGIEKGKSIRPYLSSRQIALLEKLQNIDIGLLVAFPAYEDRKRRLEWYLSKLGENNVLPSC